VVIEERGLGRDVKHATFNNIEFPGVYSRRGKKEGVSSNGFIGMVCKEAGTIQAGKLSSSRDQPGQGGHTGQTPHQTRRQATTLIIDNNAYSGGH
jgi:hypothetical protein